MNSKAKKVGKVLVFAALGFFVVWLVCFCLRYLVFQKSVSLGQGVSDHFAAIGGVFGDLHYFDDKFTILWKAAGWIVTWFTVGFGFLCFVEGLFKKKPFMFIACVAIVLSGFAVLDYIAFSGNYAYYIGKFAGKNTFYTLGLIGFICLTFFDWCLAICGSVLASKGNEPKEEAAPVEEAPAKEEPKAEEPAPAEEPAKEEQPEEAEPVAEEAKEAPADDAAEAPADNEAK